MKTHKVLIDKLGGPSALVEQLKIPQTPQSVSMWRNRGIPWQHRHKVAKLAAKRRIALPKGFLS